MTDAHRLASKHLNCHPKNHEHSNRLARSIMSFYDRGIKDVGVLSTLATNREKSLETKEQKELRQTQLPARNDLQQETFDDSEMR